MQFAPQSQQRSLSDVSEKHVRLLYVIQRTAERRGDGFFDEALAQADPKIARQDLDQVLAFARRKFGEARLEKFSLRQRASGFVQRFEKFP